MKRRKVGPASARYFDASFYRSQLDHRTDPEHHARGLLWTHFSEVGQKPSISPHFLFDLAYYRHLYPDLSDVEDAFTHFVDQGDLEQRIPHPLFDPGYYSLHHRAACSSWNGTRPWGHFLECERFTRPHPIWHCCEEGWGPSRVHDDGDGLPSPNLDVEYMRAYLSGTAPLLPSAAPLFDEEWFRMQAPLDFPQGMPALHYYLGRTGDARRSVHGSPLFDEAFYLDRYGHTLEWFESPLAAHARSADVSGFWPHPQIDPQVWREKVGQTLEPRALLTNGLTEGPAGDYHIDVLIININALAPTIYCVKTLTAVPSSLRLRVTILDNGSSSADEAHFLRKYLPGVRVITTRHRYGYGEANNILAQRADAPALLLLNNDAYISVGDLEQLHHALHHYSAAAVGCRVDRPDGSILECGGAVHVDGTVGQLARNMTTLPQTLGSRMETDFVSGACMLVSRPAFEAIKGFCPVFEPAYFEDVDLCLRLAQFGPVMVAPYIRALHYEGMTNNSESILPDRDLVVRIASMKFQGRYFDYLELSDIRERITDQDVNDQPVSAASIPQRQFQFYSPYGLMVGGGERFLLSVARACARQGGVKIAFDQVWSDYRLAHIQEELGLPREAHGLNTWHDVMEGPRPDCLFVLSNEMFPPVPARGKRNILVIQFPFPSSADMMLGLRERLASFDEIWVYSDFVARAVKAELSRLALELTVRVVSPPSGAAIRSLRQNRDVSGTLVISSVGRFFNRDHSKRQADLIDAFRELARTHPASRLVLMGAVAADRESLEYLETVKSRARGLDVSVQVNPTRARVVETLLESVFLWHGSGVQVNPALPQNHEHFGIAVAEAGLAGAVPIAADRGGPAEILADFPILQVSTFDDFPGRTLHLWSQPDALKEMSENVYERMLRFTDTAFGDRISVVLESLGLAGDSSHRAMPR